MPIEIRELHIKAVINEGEKRGGDTSQAEQPSASSAQMSDKDAIISECIEKVMEILNQKKER